MLPQPGSTNPAPCWPQAPRSTTVRYTPGPAVGFPWVSFGTAAVDLDGDGQPDFNLGGNALCTASIPACCTTWFKATGVSSNELLVVGQDPAAVASLGIVRPGYLRMRVATEPGWSYAVQQRSSIAQGNWQSAGFGFVGEFSETLLDLPMTGGAGFFRVVEAE